MIKVVFKNRLETDTLLTTAKNQRKVWLAINAQDPGRRDAITQIDLWNSIISAMEACTEE